MKAVLLAAILALMTPAVAQAQTVYLVRHAEKADASADPVLSTAGEARARDLASWLKGRALDVVLVTPLRRTALTAQPTLDGRGMGAEVISLDGGAEAHARAVADRVRRAPADAAVLVVGHSNTIPLIARALGHAEAADMPECEYDRLTVITLGAERRVDGAIWRYGAPSAC